MRPVLPTAFVLALGMIVHCGAQEKPAVASDRIEIPAAGGDVVLKKYGRNITAAYLEGDRSRKPVLVEFNEEATLITLKAPQGSAGKAVTLELSEKTQQFPGGRIVLGALDAKVEGAKAQLETHPGNHRIGYWSNPKDTVGWTYKATRPAMYDVELAYSLAGAGGHEVEVKFGDQTLQAKLPATGSWYRYTSLKLGRVYFAKPGKIEVLVRCKDFKGGAVMNFKALTLLPAPEGKPIVQKDGAAIELDAHDATAHGILLQYERKPQKLCLGYWARPEDWAAWEFEVGKAGAYQVEITQGCGKGHGGSEVEVFLKEAASGKQLGKLEFTVDDTGGFQNWKARDLGELSIKKPGKYRLEVRPKNKKGVAVMDIRRIRLLP